MATTTLSFFTPTTTPRTRSTISKQPLPFVCKTNPVFKTPISSNTFPTCSPPVKSRFQPLLKSSESEASVIDVEPTQIPDQEKVFAVVMIGSRQYIVFPGRYLTTQRLKGAEVDDKILLNKVLLVGTKKGTKTTTYVGEPIVTNAVVHAVIEDVGLNDKVIVYKYKKKKNYRRNIGHRQPNTRIRITGITGYHDFPSAEAIWKEGVLAAMKEAALEEAALEEAAASA